MKKKILGVLLVVSFLLILWGGGSVISDVEGAFSENIEDMPFVNGEDTATNAAEETVPATIPADGNPDDVTCKGSYTAEADADAVVATVGNARLTNGQLQVYYWAEVAQYQQAQEEVAPNFDRPLDSQVCQIDDSVVSWQQYFLQRALNTWHGSQALAFQSEDEGLPLEEAYQPNLKNHEKYLKNIPATRYLYGHNESYRPNTMHQEYLDNIPAMLEELAEKKGYADASAMARDAFGASEADLTAFAELYNRGYIYFTNLGYYIEPTAEEMAAYFEENKAAYTQTGSYVDIRHILLTPDGSSDAAWEACQTEASELLEYWQKKTKETDATFAELANKNSEDSGSALNGGAYRQLQKGQLRKELDDWCFDASRQAGDSTIIRSDYGYHILYFIGSTEIARAEAENDLISQMEADLIAAAREKYPMEVDYSAISLTTADGTVAAGDMLYPDVAHERFPEVPLYLQQDYISTMFGAYKITTNGCGITSFSMLASYMADDELTPPEMCDRYGSYSHSNGTDGMIFNYEPAVLGFYLKEKTYEPSVAKAALAEGHIVISIQHKGYWTSGGHYIVLEKMNEDGLIQVRDSNIYNYGKIDAHKEDLHTWGSITGAGSGYWIYEYKVTNIPACTRCGTSEGKEASPLEEDYFCEKCQPAVLRRSTYLAACGE